MPKIDGTQLVERLRNRLEDLRQGKEVAARDLRALLTDEQIATMDAAWAEQQELKKRKRAKTKQEEKKLSWKTKRETYIEAYEEALKVARDGEVEAYEKRLRDAELRQARIYFDTLGKELDADKNMQVAKNKANNALTQAKLRRLDGKAVTHISKRNREVEEMEAALRQQAEDALIGTEREQLELLRNHEMAVAENRKKRGT